MAIASQEEWLRQSEDDHTPLVFSRTILTFAAVATAIIMIAGIIGNALTIFAFWKTQRGNNVTTIFIVCLCAADLLFCLTVLPFNAVRFTVGSFKGEGLTCKLLPFLQYGNVGVSLLFIAMITINRYVMIAHYHAYTKIYRTSFIVAMILFCWIFSFGMQIPTLLGKWGTYAYDKRLSSCTILPDANGRSAKPALFFVGFVFPCLVIIFCYTRIYMVVRSSESRIRKHAWNNTKMTRKERKEVKMKKNEWRITKMVLAIFLSFLVCYLPITIIKIADSKVQYPSFHIMTYLLLYLSACINPIIYVIMNKQYRQAYKAVLTCRKPKILTLRGKNSSLADYKDKLISKWSHERKPNRFWQSISLTGPNYKVLQPNISEIERRIQKSIAKYMPSEEGIGQNNVEQAPGKIHPEQALKLSVPSKMPLRTRTLAGFEVDDDQLKQIKNKLLTNSPATADELKIIQFILAEDSFISEEEFRSLARRMREDLLLLYQADAYYAGHPKFENTVKPKAEMTVEDLKKCEPRGCDEITEVPISWRGFGGGSEVNVQEDNYGHCKMEDLVIDPKIKPPSEKLCIKRVGKCEPRSKDKSTSTASHLYCSTKDKNYSEIIQQGQNDNMASETDDLSKNLIFPEKPRECTENVLACHCTDSENEDYSTQPANWRGFGGNWMDPDECKNNKSSKLKSENVQRTRNSNMTENITNDYSKKLDFVHCNNIICDKVSEEPEDWRGFGGNYYDLESDLKNSGDVFDLEPPSSQSENRSNVKSTLKGEKETLEHSVYRNSNGTLVSQAGSVNPCPEDDLGSSYVKTRLLTDDSSSSNRENHRFYPKGNEGFECADNPIAVEEFPYEDLNVMMHSLMFKFQDLPHSKYTEVDTFLKFCSFRMNPDICARLERETQEQAENALWFKLKFGRVTASNLYAVAQCRTPGGYLVKNILGLRTWFCGNVATMRGKRLEHEVAELVGKRMNMKFDRCGLFLRGDYPILGASPDAINDTYVVEIKSPYSGKSYSDYLEDGYKVGKRYMAQVQLQMLMTGRKKGLFCVAAPDFETSRRVEVIAVEFDRKMVMEYIDRATKFWKANIFPLLTKIKREADRPPPDYRPI